MNGKPLLAALAAIMLGAKAHAQSWVQLYQDPGHHRAVTANNAARMTSEDVMQRQTDIMAGYLKKTNLNLAKVLATKKLVYDGLANVNEALKDGREIAHIGRLVAEITDESAKLLRIAAESPQFAAFARKQAVGIVRQALNIREDIDRYVLSGNGELLMDHNTRDELLRTLSDRLKLLRAEIYQTRQIIYWARMDGIWRSLSPFREWENRDREIMEDIIWKAKYLGT